jgi:hypothetical protein
MGIMVPRPAMRRREARIVVSTLKKHEDLTLLIQFGTGVSHEWASKVAYNIITTGAQRKKIWRGK